MKYEVTKKFTDGTFAGTTITEATNVKFEVGEVITKGAWTGPGYIVVAVKEATA